MRRAPYSGSQRRRAALIVVLAALCAALVKFVVRPHPFVIQSGLAPLLGPAPDFLAGVGLPFIWVVVQSRLTWPIKTPAFLSNCFWSCIILANNELWQLRDSSRAFDFLDLASGIAGAAIAFFMFKRAILPKE